MKKLLFTGISLFTVLVILMVGCKKEDPEDTKPPYYFRFYADGEYFDYQCNFMEGYLGGWTCPFAAFGPGSSTTVSFYSIYGEDRSLHSGGEGRVSFSLNPDDFPIMDTIILDGERNDVSISDLRLTDSFFNYGLQAPLSGKIIFTERTEEHLKGKFEFTAYKYHFNEEGTYEMSDIILEVTLGEFYVPSNF